MTGPLAKAMDDSAKGEEKKGTTDSAPGNTAKSPSSSGAEQTAGAGQDVAKVEAASALSALADSAVVVADQLSARANEGKSPNSAHPPLPTTPPVTHSRKPQTKQTYPMPQPPLPKQTLARPPPVHVLFKPRIPSMSPTVPPSKTKVATETNFESIPLPYVDPEVAARRAAAARAYALAPVPSTKKRASKRASKATKTTPRTVSSAQARILGPKNSPQPISAHPVPSLGRPSCSASVSSVATPTPKELSSPSNFRPRNASESKEKASTSSSASPNPPPMKSTCSSRGSHQSWGQGEKVQNYGTSPATSCSQSSTDPGDNSGCAKGHENRKGTQGDEENLSLDQSTNETTCDDDLHDDDDEYSKFVRSLMSVSAQVANFSSDQSNSRFSQVESPSSLPPLQALPMALTDDAMVGDDDDVSYQLQSDDEDDDVEVEDGDGVQKGQENKSSKLAIREEAQKRQSHEEIDAVGGTSSKPTDDMAKKSALSDVVLSPNVMAEPASVVSPQNPSTLTSDDNDLAEWLVGGDDESPVALHDELVAELEALLEEDVQAAVTTLVREDGESSVSPSRVMSPSSESTSSFPKFNKNGGIEHGESGTLGTSSLKGSDKKKSIGPGDFKREAGKPILIDTAEAMTFTGKRKSPPETPQNSSSGACRSLPQMSKKQRADLRSLMSLHYQLLIQQSILSVRALNLQRSSSSADRRRGSSPSSKLGDKHGSPCGVDNFFGGETPDELADVLHSAVGMLQDLDDNRRDAIRSSIQLEASMNPERTPKRARRTLFPPAPEAPPPTTAEDLNSSTFSDKRLTRSVFSRTLRERESGDHSGTSCLQEKAPHQASVVDVVGSSSFDVKGLSQLNGTFAMIDGSVIGAKVRSHHLCRPVDESPTSVLDAATHTEACEEVLREARADYDSSFLPNRRDLSALFTHPQGLLGPNFTLPLPIEAQVNLRKNKGIFTSTEDNLLLKGVNLYGEKEWLLVSNRYLPDRPINAISQRYCHLCLLLYKANGVRIDKAGNLETPPDIKDVSEFDEEAIARLPVVKEPAKFDVHRWSLEEDVTLLKAVPLMGHMWAEVSCRLIRHRHRGHLRKRYQVLERRVKATVKRDKKSLLPGASPTKERKSAMSKRSEETMRSGRMKDRIESQPENPKVPQATQKIAAKKLTKATEVAVPVTLTVPTASIGSANHRAKTLEVTHEETSEAYSPSPKDRTVQVADAKNVPDHVASAYSQSSAHQVREHESVGMRKVGDQSETGGNSNVTLSPVVQNGQCAAPTTMQCVDVGISGEHSDSLPHPGKAFLDASNTAAETSHSAWERIINNENDNWSQLSRLQRLMDTTDSRSSVPNSKERKHATRNSGRSQVYQCLDGEKVELPVMHIDTSSSGLSLLNNTRDGLNDSVPPTDAPPGTGESMMTKVMKRMKKTPQLQEQDGDAKEPTKEKTSKSPTDVTLCAVQEQLRTPHAPSDDLPSEMLLRTSDTVNTFTPSTCAVMSAESSSLVCPDTGGLSTFSLSEHSRQEAESGSVSRLLHATLQSFDQNEPSRQVASTAHSLVDKDLEAISALNSMSHSGLPGSNPTFPVPSPSREEDSLAVDEAKPLASSGGCASFFAKVMEPLQGKPNRHSSL